MTLRYEEILHHQADRRTAGRLAQDGDAERLVAHRFGGVVRIDAHDLQAFLGQHRTG
jgi:hypothetical protein